jgi:DNA-binding NarL/FixJ family response regulator
MCLVTSGLWSTLGGSSSRVATSQQPRGRVLEPFDMSQPTQTAVPKVRLFLVDDEPMVRRGFGLFVSLQPDLVVCGEAASELAALEQILELKPDLVVVDLGLKGGSGLELIKRLRLASPHTRTLVFSMHDEAFHVERALRAGAHGYVTKEEGTETALEAIRLVMKGQRYLGAKVAAKLTGKRSV